MRTARVIGAALVLVVALPWTSAAGTGGLKGAITTGHYPGDPVAGAVVMIDGPLLPAGPDAPHARIDQNHGVFVPRVIAVPIGTTVDFPNHDDALHNVFSTAKDSKRFDLGMYGKGETRSITFDTPGVVPVRCAVHPKMEAYVVVHVNPYVGVTDEHGVYVITAIPTGNYTARVWHERLAEKAVPVVIRDGQIEHLDLTLGPQP